MLKEYATQNEKRPFDFITKNIEEKELSYFHIEFVLNPIGYFLDGLFIKHQHKRLASYLQTLEGFRSLFFFKLLACIHKFNKDGIEKEIQAYNKKLNKEYFAVKSINLSENKKELYFEPFPFSKGLRNQVQFTLVDWTIKSNNGAERDAKKLGCLTGSVWGSAHHPRLSGNE